MMEFGTHDELMAAAGHYAELYACSPPPTAEQPLCRFMTRMDEFAQWGQGCAPGDRGLTWSSEILATFCPQHPTLERRQYSRDIADTRTDRKHS